MFSFFKELIEVIHETYQESENFRQQKIEVLCNGRETIRYNFKKECACQE